MQVKIDTSERFHVITFLEKALSANMTEYLEDKLSSVLKEDIKNVILSFEHIESVEAVAVQSVIKMQQRFIEHRASLVSCCFKPGVKQQVETADEDERLNTVPTQSEAADIILMEEIERELEES